MSTFKLTEIYSLSDPAFDFPAMGRAWIASLPEEKRTLTEDEAAIEAVKLYSKESKSSLVRFKEGTVPTKWFVGQIDGNYYFAHVDAFQSTPERFRASFLASVHAITLADGTELKAQTHEGQYGQQVAPASWFTDCCKRFGIGTMKEMCQRAWGIVTLAESERPT